MEGWWRNEVEKEKHEPHNFGASARGDKCVNTERCVKESQRVCAACVRGKKKSSRFKWSLVLHTHTHTHAAQAAILSTTRSHFSLSLSTHTHTLSHFSLSLSFCAGGRVGEMARGKEAGRVATFLPFQHCHSVTPRTPPHPLARSLSTLEEKIAPRTLQPRTPRQRHSAPTLMENAHTFLS